MLFHQNTRKAVKVAMFIVGVLVIVSMVIMYLPTPTASVNSSPTPSPTPVVTTPNKPIPEETSALEPLKISEPSLSF